ncbi:hypothetical protein AX774_g939 [Zancudomyces culisetae]|uniref:Uncharacterized protein n=1 Tax=Zancudomyces culisetae TaxID=1213189 RepID=A0A1R1PX82_ZANCU|nr:hypothetical protein AX774_g939 [Zancudomyces culisetae]|eukprot:OMH85507.1 hypothetical protein AX774_g939 [Zancudomyces culisetae]
MEIDNDVNKINFSIFEALKIQEKVYFNPLNHTRVPTRPVNPVLGSKSKKSDFREDKGMSVIEISDDSDDMEDNFKDNDQSDSNLLTDDSFFVSPEIAFAHYE